MVCFNSDKPVHFAIIILPILLLYINIFTVVDVLVYAFGYLCLVINLLINMLYALLTSSDFKDL